MSMHPRQSRIRLQERDNPGTFIAFPYNPSEWRDTRETEYEEVEVPGTKTQTVQFSMGKPRELSMTLFLNEWGETPPTGKRVEEIIAWLRDKQVPRGGSGGFLGIGGEDPAPPVLQLVWREVFTCVLTSVNVRPLAMRPANGGVGKEFDAIRAEVEIALKEFVEGAE